MNKLSKAGYGDTSPFLEVQARDIPDGRLAAEFWPTSTFWNLFTSGHQVLLGTRGSGKTSLIRMLTYGCLRLLNQPKAKTFVREKKFIGFYVPLHLEQMTLISQNDESYEDRVGYFKFIFNHIAAGGFLATLKNLLEDSYKEGNARLEKEIEICHVLIKYWYGSKSRLRPTLASIYEELSRWSYNTDRWRDKSQPEVLPPLCKSCLDPIVVVLPHINQILEIDSSSSTWMACIDEAEFLKEPFLKAVNSFMRSQNRGIVVKLATAPFRYTEDTEVRNTPLEPNGNDFRYIVTDMNPEGDEFARLCDHLCRSRLARFGNVSVESLSHFLQEREDDSEGRMKYAKVFGPESLEASNLFDEITKVLPPQRTHTAKKRASEGKDLKKPYINKYAPVLYVRRLKSENDKGNTNVGWYSGVKTMLLVSEGNPRRFLDLMHLLYEEHRASPLSPRTQQEIVLKFAKTVQEQSDGLPEHGPLVRSILDAVLQLLAARVHGQYMMNGGCAFFVSHELLRNPEIVDALKTAIRFSRITCEDATNYNINPESVLRVSYTLSPNFWLPMREGDRPVLGTSSLFGSSLELPQAETPSLRKKTAELFVDHLNLKLEVEETEGGYL